MEPNFHYPAEYYDEDYSLGMPNRGDIEFYKKYAIQAGAPVLELGCGTGRILIPIAQEGIESHGLDMSREMLGVCETKARTLKLQNVHLKCSSMDEFDYPERFSLIYIPFRSFQHLLTAEEQIRCLSLVRKHLKDEGLFIMDVFAPNINKLARYVQKQDWEKEFSRKNEGTESAITRYYQARADLATQTLQVTMKWEEREEDGSVIARKMGEFKLRYIFRYELEHLLVRCGFEPEIYGHFDQRPYDYISGEIVAICRKK